MLDAFIPNFSIGRELHYVAASGSADLLAIGVFAGVAIIVGIVLLLLSELLGPRRRDAQKETIYECGVPLLDSAREPFTVKFYLVAILFILFDIETVFLLPYAVVYQQLGVVGLAEMGVFLFVLSGGLIYLWKRGALEWD
ncbi:MAG: NADH-quinone oxidoreductase subunit A [Planctomycetota bacterium]